MPDMSHVKTFVEALKTGMTKTTQALDKCNYKSHRAELGIPGALSSGPNNSLPQWARDELTRQGLNNAELQHIDIWPKKQKEDVRKAIVKALNKKRTLKFFWKLHEDKKNGTHVKGLRATTGKITITFLSPRKNVTVSANATGEIDVSV